MFLMLTNSYPNHQKYAMCMCRRAVGDFLVNAVKQTIKCVTSSEL